jgi:hypothetical protein
MVTAMVVAAVVPPLLLLLLLLWRLCELWLSVCHQ